MKNINELLVAKSMLYGGVLLLSLSSLLLFTYMRVPETTETEDVSAAVVAPASQDPPFGLMQTSHGGSPIQMQVEKKHKHFFLIQFYSSVI